MGITHPLSNPTNETADRQPTSFFITPFFVVVVYNPDSAVSGRRELLL
jgi:hypothetical protein